MALKETKKDRERQLKKVEELTTATDAPTDGPTGDNEPDKELLYNAEGRLLKPRDRPGTSVEAHAALAGSTAVAALATTDSSDADGITTQEEKGSTRTRTRTFTPTRAKRASSRSSRSRSKPKKKKSKKDRRRRHKRESSFSSSAEDRRRGRGRSSSSSCSSSLSSGDSDWEEFYDHNTVVKVRALLKAAPPRAPRDVSKGRFSFEASGEVLYVRKADKGKKDKWMREWRGRRSDHYADYKRSISRLGHSGNDRVLRQNFGRAYSP
jgi:hypothetical protein